MKSLTFFIFIVIFPLIKIASAQDTLILQPGPEGKDAFLDDWYTNPHGDYPNMFALAGTSNGDPVLMRSLIEFDLSSIPSGSIILEARLSLFFANNPSVPHYHYGDNLAYLQRVIEPWDEQTVNWYNQPAATEENQVVLPVSQYPDQDYIDIDVRDVFQDLVDDPENGHGLLFRLQTEVLYRRMFFASGDNENPELWPKLEIIYDTCTLPVTGFTYTAEELDVYFQDTSQFAAEYYWDFGDGYYSDLTNPWHHYQEEGLYEVCLTTRNDCWSNTVCEWIEVCELPQSDFVFTIEDLTAFFEDQSVKADFYYWDFGDGYFSDLQNPIHIYDTQENYQICLTTWNACGADTACEMLYLSTVFIPETIEDLFTIYPNPARDVVFLKTSLNGTVEFRLLDLSGKEVQSQVLDIINGEIIRLSLVDIVPGLYIVRIDSGNNQSFGKLVIAR